MLCKLIAILLFKKYIFLWVVIYLDDNGGYGGCDDDYGLARSLLVMIINLSLNDTDRDKISSYCGGNEK